MTKIKDVRIMQIGESKFRVEYQVENPAIGGFEPDLEWYSYDVLTEHAQALMVKNDLIKFGLDGVEINDVI